MNTPEYKKAYLATLKSQISVNNKNLAANNGNPSAQQYIQNTGQPILGISTFKSNMQAKGKNKK